MKLNIEEQNEIIINILEKAKNKKITVEELNEIIKNEICVFGTGDNLIDIAFEENWQYYDYDYYINEELLLHVEIKVIEYNKNNEEKSTVELYKIFFESSNWRI